MRRLRERFPALLDPPSDDICYATQNRQVAVKEIAAERRPGDRRRLDELVELGAPRRGRARDAAPSDSRLVDKAAELDEAWLDGVHGRRRHQRRVGARDPGARGARLAGRARLRRRRGGRSAEESLLFALPPELRRDMKAAGVSA